MKHVMVDLETMSNKPDASIVQLGAVEFELMGAIGQTFKVTLRLQDSIDRGLRVDGSTVEWWLRQSQAARDSILTEGGPLGDGLARFDEWYRSTKAERVWANGADFDIPILRSAYTALGRETPWIYNAGRCMRTFKEFCLSVGCVEPVIPGTVSHDALEDALWQAKYMQALGVQMRDRIKR